MIDTKRLDKILPLVEKPGRYTGGELGAVYKDVANTPIRFLFAFPDVYEVGMSHLGSVILYHMTNAREDTYAERAYAPFPDMQAQMQKEGIELYSLETFTEAKAFDMIGFNLSYEMCYTTVLLMLRLAGLSELASERKEGPLVIAGGTCVYNPEPLADFIDLFVIGEGEEVNGELLDLYAQHKKQGYDKQTFLEAAGEIPGIYVPSLVDVCYYEDGTVQAITGPNLPIQKRYITDFNKSYYPTELIIPNIGVVHDRVVLEIFRGCTRGCRFCQAGYIYRPVREKQTETLLCQAKQLIGATGYDEISLSSLSSGDYSDIENLAFGLLDEFSDGHTSVSLPSLRVDSFGKEYAKRMQEVRKTGFTFAPEAGTQRLRDVINKNITEEDILSGVKNAFESGASTVKLYFMIGLPTETYADLDGISDLVQKIRGLYYDMPKQQRSGSLKINVSTASFVPKPITPFQWVAQDSMEMLQEKQAYLKEKLSMPNVRYSWHESKLSFLEAIFARGDRRLSGALLYASRAGAQFDSWQDMFRFDLFLEAFDACGIDPAFYANRVWAKEEMFPYEHIDTLVSKAYLYREWELAQQAVTTPDCRLGCLGCGNFDGVYCNA